MESLVSDLSVVSAHVLLPDAYRTGIPPVDQTFGDFAAGDLDAPSQLEAELNPALEGGRPAGRSARDARLHRRDRRPSRRRSTSSTSSSRTCPGSTSRTAPGIRRAIPRCRPSRASTARGRRSAGSSSTRGSATCCRPGTWTGSSAISSTRLRRIGVFDRALVVVAADHGIAFVPGVERREVQPTTVDQLAGVPLFVKAPGQRRGEVDERPALTVDVLPTIAEMLGVELPFDVDGEALTGPPPADARGAGLGRGPLRGRGDPVVRRLPASAATRSSPRRSRSSAPGPWASSIASAPARS